MMDIWTIPYLVVLGVIAWIGFASVRGGFPKIKPSGDEATDIHESVKEHPFTLNPILWVLLIATIFTFIIIFYYATL